MTDTKLNAAWEKLFDKYDILNEIHKNTFFKISADNIKEFREPRLMTKFDNKSNLPDLFKEHKLSILPITRGDYFISTIETFHDFNNSEANVEKINFPGYIESIDFKNISSEATALNCAFVSGMITDFSEDTELMPTVNGRMSSSSFDFSINSTFGPLKIDVVNSQIEIDGGYEGHDYLSLIEAKNYISDDFLVRQLFYPLKLWSGKISKPVKSVFLTYTNGIFHFREYEFKDLGNYNSVSLCKEKKYAIRDGSINTELIQKTLERVEIVEEPEIPFPQADSFERVINLCELINDNGYLTSDFITENYDFDSRQTSYYTSAALYLGLIEKAKNTEGERIYVLSQKGIDLFKLNIVDRQLEFAKIILAHKAFNATLKLYFEKAEPPHKDEVVEIMKNSNLYNVDSDSTYTRRSSTVLSWVNWIFSLIEE